MRVNFYLAAHMDDTPPTGGYTWCMPPLLPHLTGLICTAGRAARGLRAASSRNPGAVMSAQRHRRNMPGCPRAAARGSPGGRLARSHRTRSLPGSIAMQSTFMNAILWSECDRVLSGPKTAARVEQSFRLSKLPLAASREAELARERHTVISSSKCGHVGGVGLQWDTWKCRCNISW